MMEKRYRDGYTGEYVITKTVFKSGGKKEQTREWVDNPLSVSSLNNRACCVAPGEMSKTFPMNLLERHPGGLLNRDRMQLYGVEEIWEKMNSSFLVVLTQSRLDEIMEKNYQVDHVVYTSSSLCIKNPGEFYMIPYGTNMVSSALAVWLACFDGHKDIYLFGYDENIGETPQVKLINAIKEIMTAYNDVNFYHVCNRDSPDSWRRCINFSRLTRNEFVSQCDI